MSASKENRGITENDKNGNTDIDLNANPVVGVGRNTRTPKSADSFYSSLLCFCTWGEGSNTKSPQQPKSPNREIRTRVPRIRKINFVDEDSLSRNETVSDYQSIGTDTSGSIYSNSLGVDGKGSKKKNKKKKKRKNIGLKDEDIAYPRNDNSQRSIPEEVDLAEIAQEFITIMQGGMKLMAATSIGSIREVNIVTDGIYLTWGLSKAKPGMSILLRDIFSVKKGMPPKLINLFLASDIERSFYLVLKGDSKAATFLAPTSLERDALVHSFQLLIATLNFTDESLKSEQSENGLDKKVNDVRDSAAPSAAVDTGQSYSSNDIIDSQTNDGSTIYYRQNNTDISFNKQSDASHRNTTVDDLQFNEINLKEG